jgi:hypothetical protein
MKNKFFVSILGIFLIFGFSLIGCDNNTDGNETTPFEGTWQAPLPDDFPVGELSGKLAEMEFSGNSWLQKIDGDNYAKGTFSYDSINFYQKLTHIYDNGWEELIDIDENILEYKIQGNTLTLSNAEQGNFSLTKKK